MGKIPAALRGHQFTKGGRKGKKKGPSKAAARKGGRTRPARRKS